MKKIFISLFVVACALSYSCKNEGSKHKIEKQDIKPAIIKYKMN